MSRTFSGSVTTAETKTFSGNPPLAIVARNLDDTTTLEVQVPRIHGTSDWAKIPPGGEGLYRSDRGITSVNIRGEESAPTDYCIDIVVGTHGD